VDDKQTRNRARQCRHWRTPLLQLNTAVVIPCANNSITVIIMDRCCFQCPRHSSTASGMTRHRRACKIYRTYNATSHAPWKRIMAAKTQSRKAEVQLRSQRPEPDSKSMQIDNTIVSMFLRYLSSEGSYNLWTSTVDVDVPQADSTPPSPSPPTESFHIEVGPSTATGNPPVASSMSGQTQGSPVAMRCHFRMPNAI